MAEETWKWFWVALAAILIVGEAFTLTFFLIPFAIGAAIAAIVAFAGLNAVWQLSAFIVVSLIMLPLLRRFARHQDSLRPPAVGAERYVGQIARVLEPIDVTGTSGLVRADTEEWRAIARGITEEIPAGTSVRVLGIDGTRLVVEPAELVTSTVSAEPMPPVGTEPPAHQ